jgi:hypothetical protein
MTGISTSILVDKVIGGSPSTDSEAAGNTREDQDTPFKYLDYALLRLSFPATKRPDGVPRGYYLLRSDAYESETSQEFHQAQYPLGGPIVLSPIANPPGLDKSKTRIRYTCNTSYGSSGGPMVDNQGRLVAIHQYAAGRTGRGVPISAIANHLLNTPHARLFDTVTTSGVTHLGHYSTSTRDEICSRIDVPWHVVASELNAPGSVVSPLDLWEWLRSSRKLYQLRSTFTRLGYLELAKILDRDLIDQSHARELSRLDEMSSLAGRLLNSVTRGQSATQLLDLAVRTHDVTGLAGRLRDALDALPAWHEDQRLQIGWRMDWSTEVTRAKKAIDKVSGIFPVSNSDESQGRRSVRVAMANAREAASAIAALSKLARKWPLVP